MSEIVDVPILLVHVSGAETVEQIRWAQGRVLGAAEPVDPVGAIWSRRANQTPPRARMGSSARSSPAMRAGRRDGAAA